MITERLKKLADQYMKDYWQLSHEERKEVENTFLFITTKYCNCDETEVILRGGCYNDIEWN